MKIFQLILWLMGIHKMTTYHITSNPFNSDIFCLITAKFITLILVYFYILSPILSVAVFELTSCSLSHCFASLLPGVNIRAVLHVYIYIYI